jgi:dimethylaniline monooxygenase (N-oxide forming)
MAIAQIFAGRYTLPPKPQIYAQIATFHENLLALVPLGLRHANRGRMSRQILTNEADWRWFLNDAAGTGINERLSWNATSWAFWLKNFRLSNLLMGGVDSPHVLRLFPTRAGGPARWDGAMKEIEWANEEVEKYVKANAEEERKKGEEKKSK